jgi:hypothetical protein
VQPRTAPGKVRGLVDDHAIFVEDEPHQVRPGRPLPAPDTRANRPCGGGALR